MLLVPFSSCCCYKFWLPVPPAAAEAFAAAAGPWMGKHHGSEGRRSPKIAPRNFWNYCRGFCYCCSWSSDRKTLWKKSPPDSEIPMPNVTSETHRKWWFWHLFPLAAAMNFGYLFLLLLQKKLLLLLLLVPGWGRKSIQIATKNSLM